MTEWKMMEEGNLCFWFFLFHISDAEKSLLLKKNFILKSIHKSVLVIGCHRNTLSATLRLYILFHLILKGTLWGGLYPRFTDIQTSWIIFTRPHSQ